MDDPERKAQAKRRLRACKLCSTSFYVALSALPVFFLLLPLAGAVAGAVALVMGLVGRTQLARMGRASVRRDRSAPAVERVAARMQSRAEREGLLGPLIGGALLAYYLVILLAATSR